MYPIIFSLVAGLCTSVGALLVFICKPSKILMAVSIGFASGVMLTLAFAFLLPEAITINYWLGIIGFISGALFILILDAVLPHIEFSVFEKGIIDKKMFRSASLIAIGMALHNMPEGFAVSAGFYHLPIFGLTVALAIALHNIPEGIVISLPIISAGGTRKKAFFISLLSGLSEPIGAAIGVLLLSFVLDLVPIALAFAAGVMVYLTVDELLPLARQYGHSHKMGLGIIIGCLVAMLIGKIV